MVTCRLPPAGLALSTFRIYQRHAHGLGTCFRQAWRALRRNT